ncbi:zinc-binding alcohol dehydrogenase family protein [Sulfurivirga sp.]|uniref:zinc-binding alcohol dehydrogenase family protein n=1 Tax=Sulfurivirga sp. TaxID=2614236 RepID=UPI0025F8A588|nr:zinc-binding alcohol dehydrogenase family protein [Sulfurivirga sp.]
MMRQWVAVGTESGAVWQVRDSAPPAPAAGELVVRVHAVSVNPVDTKLFAALRPGQEKVLGFDAAGVVEAVGEGVTDFAPGDEVFYAGDVTRDGSFATHQRVDARLVARKPESLSFAEAAALPLVSLTAAESLFEHLALPFPADGRLLVINGAGGVGSMAIQLGRLAGAEVMATASREESAAWCRALGADEVIGHDAVAGIEADWILNAAHNLNDTLEAMAQAVRPFGRVCALASAKGPVDINLFKDKSVGFEWTFMFTRAKHGVAPERQGAWLRRIARWVDGGQLRGIARTDWGELSPETLARAFEEVRSGRMIGKGVLTLPQEP